MALKHEEVGEFVPRFLTKEQLEQHYYNALQQVEASVLQAHINETISPGDYSEHLALLRNRLRLLEMDFASVMKTFEDFHAPVG